jgi:hypothetical protein
MPHLIIIRLHPVAPTTGYTVTGYLNTLSIKAFDPSLGDNKKKNLHRGREGTRNGQCVSPCICADQSLTIAP